MDITSLYTVIPNNEGLQALRFFFDQRTIKEPSSETLLCLAELVLTPSCFLFADNHFKQVNGKSLVHDLSLPLSSTKLFSNLFPPDCLLSVA